MAAFPLLVISECNWAALAGGMPRNVYQQGGAGSMLQPNAFGAACSRIAFDAADWIQGQRSLAIAAPLSASSLSSLIASLDGGFRLRWRFSTLSISFVFFPFHYFVVFDYKCHHPRIFFSDFLKQQFGSFVHTPHGFCVDVLMFS